MQKPQIKPFRICPSELSHSLQILILRHANQQLVVNVLVDLKFRMALQPFTHSGFGIVAHILGAIRECPSWQIFNGRIEHDAVAAHGNKIGIGIQLSHHMPVGVVGVQRHQHKFKAKAD